KYPKIETSYLSKYLNIIRKFKNNSKKHKLYIENIYKVEFYPDIINCINNLSVESIQRIVNFKRYIHKFFKNEQKSAKQLIDLYTKIKMIESLCKNDAENTKDNGNDENTKCSIKFSNIMKKLNIDSKDLQNHINGMYLDFKNSQNALCKKKNSNNCKNRKINDFRQNNYRSNHNKHNNIHENKIDSISIDKNTNINNANNNSINDYANNNNRIGKIINNEHIANKILPTVDSVFKTPIILIKYFANILKKMVKLKTKIIRKLEKCFKEETTQLHKKYSKYISKYFQTCTKHSHTMQQLKKELIRF
ncbi:hypothetical protein EDEG_02101, partial [Edhazardia aedis USNM 41457]